MLPYIKKLLHINNDLDEDDESQLEQDIQKLSQVVNSSKFADSNADTAHIERLFSALKVADNKPDGHAIVRDPTSEPRELSTNVDYSQMQNINNNFRDKLSAHLELLEELEGEAQKSFLTGPPVFEKRTFGKEGGNQEFKLRSFSVPKFVFESLEFGTTAAASRLNIGAPLSVANYVQKFQRLLWVEEAWQAIEMRKFDLKDAFLAVYERDYYLLEVPGLAEGRPSLMRGDKLTVKNNRRSNYYEGYITEVRENDIIFRLHESVHASGVDGLRFDIAFHLSRTPFRRSHHGVLQFHENPIIAKIAFPRALQEHPEATIEKKETDIKFLQRLNTYQKKAVISVLEGAGTHAPFIIFGPPGTGKTQTLVEAILQVYARKPKSKILVVANANSAVDLITKRIKALGFVPKEKMLRVAAFYRMEKLIPPEIEDITFDMDMLSSQIYRESRIVFTTCIQSGALNEFVDKFDYLFLDEAGHANEPETLIAASLLKKDGRFILAGDPHQLGPVCISNLAKLNGLGLSMLERLCGRSAYQRKIINSKMAYDERYITRLLISYRSDPRVLSVNNKLFYHDELKCNNKSPKSWLDLLKVNHPLVFNTIKGKDRREFLTPSWFNPNEAIACIGYVNRLYRAGLRPEQLGIITPYRRQIEKLNLLFESCKLNPCKIGTMEEFQGDEREIIIISTVRTREKQLDFDKQFNLGFLFDEKRFNVAVSRAKWMVIVVGDPTILSRDRCWTEFMKVAHMIEEKPTESSETRSN